jgi:hypothetical protein
LTPRPDWLLCRTEHKAVIKPVIAHEQVTGKNGVSITQTPGEEKFVKCRLGAFRGQIYYQYDYRHTDGELFSTVAKTLDECRRRRDEWVAKKNGVINK